MIKNIALTFFLSITIGIYAACNMGGSFKCESYTDNGLNGLVLDPWQVYEGRYSCTSQNTANYYYDIEDITVRAGMTLEINFKTDSSAELDIKAITTNGNRHVQRIRDLVVYDAVDGRRWHWHTYRFTFAGKTTSLTKIRIKIPAYTNIDDFEWSVIGDGPTTPHRYLQLSDNIHFNYTISEDDFFSATPKNWSIELEGIFGANDEALLGLAPRNIDPIFITSCDSVTDSLIVVDSSESGNDSFTIECDQAVIPLKSLIPYIRIKNNTNKSYCSAINFTIQTHFNLIISDDIESTDYTEVFDIITEFK